MKRLSKSLILSLFLAFTGSSYAQIETKTETIGDAELTTTMDNRIRTTIENLENSCNKNSSKNTGVSATTTPAAPTTKSSKPLSNAEICKQNPRILGYKLQIAVVKSKEEADKIRASFREKFPSIKVEIDASLRPNYKILAGSYFSKESANPDLRQVRKSFGSTVAVQYRVFCAEAK